MRRSFIENLLLIMATGWVLFFVIFGMQATRGQGYDYQATNWSLSNAAVTSKSSATAVIWLSCYNPNATVAFLQIFDSPDGVVVGTTPAARTFQLGALVSSGIVTPSPPLSVNNSLRVAMTTINGGGSAPTLNVNCDFAVR